MSHRFGDNRLRDFLGVDGRVWVARVAAMLKRTILFAGISLFALGSVSGKTRAELTQERVAANPKAKWWEQMDTGPFISDTFLGFGPKGDVAVLKGIAIKLGANEDHYAVPYVGINGYPNGTGIRTYTTSEWDELIKQSGFTEHHYYLPFLKG